MGCRTPTDSRGLSVGVLFLPFTPDSRPFSAPLRSGSALDSRPATAHTDRVDAQRVIIPEPSRLPSLIQKCNSDRHVGVLVGECRHLPFGFIRHLDPRLLQFDQVDIAGLDLLQPLQASPWQTASSSGSGKGDCILHPSHKPPNRGRPTGFVSPIPRYQCSPLRPTVPPKPGPCS